MSSMTRQPLWLALAVGGALILIQVAIVQYVSIRVPAEPLLIALAVIAVLDGLLRRRWIPQAIIAAALIMLAILPAVGALDVSLASDGPGDLPARAGWTTVLIVYCLLAAWGWSLSRRSLTSPAVVDDLIERADNAQDQYWATLAGTQAIARDVHVALTHVEDADR